MGRGIQWTAEEIAHLSRAWVSTSEDPIAGIDQTSSRFNESMFKTFAAMAPSSASEKQYGARTPKSCRSKMNEVSADCQKFRSALRFISTCKPTGVSIEQILSLSIAKHLGKRESMSYDAKNFPHDQWNNHLAYKTLCKHPKFNADLKQLFPQNFNEAEETSNHVSVSSATTLIDPEADFDRSNTVFEKSNDKIEARGGHSGRKKREGIAGTINMPN